MKQSENNKSETEDIYTRKLPSCPVCNGTSLNFLYKILTYTPSFTVDRCKTCGFIFMNPRFKNSVIIKLYGSGYYTGNAEYSYHDERKATEYFSHVWDKRIRIIRTYVKKGNLLDVGCSFGGFLKSASKYFAPHGIEISSFAAGHAKSIFGDAIHAGTLADHRFKENYFSVITMIELLEHLPDPGFAVRECHRLLRKDGLLVIQTANMDGLQAKIFGRKYAYFMPGHLSYFSRKSLLRILRNSGFGNIKVYYPVEFGLLPKLKKSKYSFKSFWDYRKWFRIAAYHYAGKIHFGNFAVTSSMVLYAVK